MTAWRRWSSKAALGAARPGVNNGFPGGPISRGSSTASGAAGYQTVIRTSSRCDASRNAADGACATQVPFTDLAGGGGMRRQCRKQHAADQASCLGSRAHVQNITLPKGNAGQDAGAPSTAAAYAKIVAPASAPPTLARKAANSSRPTPRHSRRGPPRPARAPPIRPGRPARRAAGDRVEPDHVAVAHLARAARRPAPPGVTWIAAGTLPDAPRHAPVGDQRDLEARSCSTPSGGVSLCSSGMPLACGPWKRTTATKSRSSSPALKAASSSSWLSKTTRRRLDRRGARADRRDLDHGAAEIAAQQLQPAARLERRRPPGAAIVVVAAVAAPASRQTQPSVVEPRLDARSARRPAAARRSRTSSCSRPASSSSRIRKPMPPAAWNWFTSALPFG